MTLVNRIKKNFYFNDSNLLYTCVKNGHSRSVMNIAILMEHVLMTYDQIRLTLYSTQAPLDVLKCKIF